MKRIKILNFGFWICGALLLASCSKNALTKVNQNLNNPEDVPARFTVTDVITSTAFNVVGGDISLYASIYAEHEGGVWNQQFYAETRTGEPSSATTYNNVWNTIYNNIKELKIVIDKTADGGEEESNKVTGGIARVLMAYNLGVLTDYWGDAPFSQTGIMNPDGTPKFLQPVIDKQSDLYPQIQQFLDDAITDLDGTDENAIGGQDLIYKGNKDSWKKFAYGLKARYTMHALFRSSNQTTDLNNVLDYISKSFTSPDEEALFAIYDGDAQVNPLAAFSYSRDGLGASRSLLNKFKALNDPRGGQSFMKYVNPSRLIFAQVTLEDALAESVPNGNPEQKQYSYNISIPEYAFSAPTELFSYHELMFLKAETLVRLGRDNDAKSPLNEAVVAAFANLQRTLTDAQDNVSGLGNAIDLSASVANNYFKDEVLPMFNSNPLKAVMLQKYLAFFGASGESTEAFNDIRRLRALDEGDLIELENPLNATKFPLRYSYGNSDVLANAGVASAYGDGQYVYTEKVWWAGGNR